MHEDIDPYRQWLGRTTPDRPLNHYQLLDLPDFEEDRERIENAGMIELAKVLRHDSGPQTVVARRLCDELQQAVDTLCDGAKKAAYDAELRWRRSGNLYDQTDSPAATHSAGGVTTSPMACSASADHTRGDASVLDAPSSEVAVAPGTPARHAAVFRPTIRPAFPPGIPVKPLVGAMCALGLTWSGFALWNLVGGKEQPPRAPVAQQGVIDTTLPAALREKQALLKGVLDDLEQGMPYSKLKEFNPSLRLTESAQDFYRGVVGLERWEFNGKPQQDDVPVVLYMSEDKPGNPEKRVERIYTVKGAPGQFTISRKK